MLIELGELLGWFVVGMFGLAMLNFFLKFFNKNYATKVFKGKDEYLKLYRKIMGYIVKYHKYFGGAAALIVFLHFIIMWKNITLSISGLVAMILLIIVALTGVVLQFNKKIDKIKLKKVHTILSFFLLVSIIIHLT